MPRCFFVREIALTSPAMLAWHSRFLAFLQCLLFLSAPLFEAYSLLLLSGALMAAGVLLVMFHRRIAKWPVTAGRIETVNVNTVR